MAKVHRKQNESASVINMQLNMTKIHSVFQLRLSWSQLLFPFLSLCSLGNLLLLFFLYAPQRFTAVRNAARMLNSPSLLSSVQLLSRLFATPWIAACQASLSITNSWVHSNSCPSSRWCHPTISSSVVPFSSCPQSLPASQSFPMSHLFSWGGQSTGVSALAPFLPKNTQDWSPLEGTGWISLQSKGLSRVFSNTTVQKHQFFGAQLSS